MKTTDDIRKEFLDFFASKGHKIIASDSVVPKEDPTVLFTTAGMQQFKRQFLGQIDDYTRAASSQKCLRTDDLEKVGKTACHHTFFEMLGNFSFGDYFKREAIEWAWEFLTKNMNIPPEKLWVSVYRDDEVAYGIWRDEIRIPEEKIIRLGDKSNFWPSEAKQKGPNGPCGPCSEIFYDYGPNPECTNKNCNPDCECGRFSEIWNLVFTQFNRKETGELEPLPSQNIDTGMGLERLAAVLQGKKTNFEIDIFQAILSGIEQTLGEAYGSIPQVERHIIADHIRAIVFGIADGVVPSNEGRGYVIKRLIIDATDICLRAGSDKPAIYKLVPFVVNAMGKAYPDIARQAEHIGKVIRNIESSYRKVCVERIPELKKDIQKAPQDPEKLGELIFRYRDTYGLTRRSIEKITNEFADNNVIDGKTLEKAWSSFDRHMRARQELSRSTSKMTGDVFADTKLDLNVAKTQFIGYDHLEGQGRVLRLFADGKAVANAGQGKEIIIVLDRTPFYAEAGGQIGDTGMLTGPKGTIRVTDTQKTADIFLHYGIVEKGTIHQDDALKAKVDALRRWSIMRNHTATHLLQAALRDTLGRHVQQQGSLVAEDRLRFDFTHPQAVTQKEIQAIEDFVNACILANDPVNKDVMPIEDAKKSGALAFFAEKYGDIVRVVSVDDYSKEFCGGTHLKATGQIGLFKITQESAIAQGIRRLEAVTGTWALQYVKQMDHTLTKIAQILKASPNELVSRVETQAKRLKALEKELAQTRFEAFKSSVEPMIEDAKTLKGVKIVTHIYPNVTMDVLRKLSDLIKQKADPVVIALATVSDQGGQLIIRVSDNVTAKGVRADELVRDVAPLFNGSGGGRPQMAQAGSKDGSGLSKVLAKITQIVESKLT